MAKKKEALDPTIWGIGIEHEVLPLYVKTYKRKLSSASPRMYPVRDAVLLSDRVWAALESILSDPFGRDAKRYPMHVTGDFLGNRECVEFSTRDWKKRTLAEYINDLVSTREAFLQDLNAVMAKLYPHRVLRDGGFRLEWPVVGADYLLYPRNKRFVDIPRYLGSYHINVTLPHNEKITNQEFVMIHQKAALAIQWIEPLLMAMLCCPHPSSVFDGHEFTELSVRHAEEPLAMALGRDILKYGFSKDRKHEDLQSSSNPFLNRVTKHKFALEREHLLTHQPGLFDPTDASSTKRALSIISKSIKDRVKMYPLWLKYVFKKAQTSPIALKHFIRFRYGSYADGFNDMPVIGTDFRRDASKGPRFGFEFRLLDYFPPDKLEDVLRLLFYVMDCSHSWPNDKAGLKAVNPHSNERVHMQIVHCILEGWNTPADEEYVKALSKALSLKDLKGGTCAEVMDSLQDCLFKKVGQGKGPYSKYIDLTPSGKYFENSTRIPNINKESWDYFFERSYGDVASKVVKHKKEVEARDLLKLLRLKDSSFNLGRVQEDVDDVEAYRQKSINDKRLKSIRKNV